MAAPRTTPPSQPIYELIPEGPERRIGGWAATTLEAAEHIKKLTSSPGTWMRVITFNGNSPLHRSSDLASRLRLAVERGLFPPGKWEIVARQDKAAGRSYVYAKFEKPSGVSHSEPSPELTVA